MNISDENKTPLVIELLTEIYTQNRIIAEMVLPLYCEKNNVAPDKAKEFFNQFFISRKQAKDDKIFAEYGRLSIDDILG